MKTEPQMSLMTTEHRKSIGVNLGHRWLFSQEG
jgi:hypothetical protein